MKQLPSGHQLPGPAALRSARERNTPGYQRVVALLGERNVQLHARGANAPRGPVPLTYERYLRIPVHAWWPAAKLAAVGLDANGKKLHSEEG